MASPFPPPPQVSAPVPVSATIISRVAPAGAGLTWWADGWRMFAAQPLTWFGIVIINIVISWLLGKVQYIGGIAHWLLIPVFVGGIMLGCHALAQGQRLRLSHLFDGFKGPLFTPLLIVGAINVLLTALAVCIGLVFVVTGIGLSALMNISQLAVDPLQILGVFGVAGFLVLAAVLFLVAVIFMVTWFAPAVIVLQDARPWEAMAASFRACMRNWAAFLVYGAIGIGIMIAAGCVFGALVAAIGIGTLMTIFEGSGSWEPIVSGIVLIAACYLALTVIIAPVIFGSIYSGYRDTLAPKVS